MTTLLERHYYALCNFVPWGNQYDNVRQDLENLYQHLKELNDDNIKAHVPVGYLEEETRNITDRDDYTVRQYTKYVVRDNLRDIEKEFDDEDDMLEYADQLKEELADFILHSPDLAIFCNAGTIEVNYKEDFIDTIFFVPDCDYNCDSCLAKDLKINQLDEDALRDLRKVISDYIEEEDSLETEETEEENECYWNTVWRYNGTVNEDVARKVGFCLVDFDDGETYFGLQGCGMDLSPLFVAYQALAYGFVQEEYVSKFHTLGLEYMAYVMGRELFNEVMGKLGLSQFIENCP